MMYIFLKPYRVMFKFKLDAEYKMVKSAKKKKTTFYPSHPLKHCRTQNWVPIAQVVLLA